MGGVVPDGAVEDGLAAALEQQKLVEGLQHGRHATGESLKRGGLLF